MSFLVGSLLVFFFFRGTFCKIRDARCKSGKRQRASALITSNTFAAAKLWFRSYCARISCFSSTTTFHPFVAGVPFAAGWGWGGGGAWGCYVMFFSREAGNIGLYTVFCCLAWPLLLRLSLQTKSADSGNQDSANPMIQETGKRGFGNLIRETRMCGFGDR